MVESALRFTPMSEQPTKKPRIHMVLGESMVQKLEVIQEITGLPSRADAARFAMVRGLESMNPQIQNYELLKRVEEKLTPEELLPLFEQIEKGKTEE